MTGVQTCALPILASGANTNTAAYLLSPGPIGSQTPNAGYFTTLRASGITEITNATNNNGVQYNSGALQVTGGAGIQGNLYVGGNLFASNLYVTSTTSLNVTAPLVYLAASTPETYNYEIGFYSHFGDVVGGTNYQHTGLIRDHTTNVWVLFGNVSEPQGSIVNFATVTYDGLILGNLSIANNTPSTSTTTGALTIKGGAGIGGQLWTGGNANVGGSLRTSNIIADGPSYFNQQVNFNTQIIESNQPGIALFNNPQIDQIVFGTSAPEIRIGDESIPAGVLAKGVDYVIEMRFGCLLGGGTNDNSDDCVKTRLVDGIFDCLKVSLPSAVSASTPSYGFFTWSTIGFVTHDWLMGTVGEAWEAPG